MAILENARHEHFAQGVAAGKPASQAYIEAGFSASGAAQSARRLLQSPQVQARVKELSQVISEGLSKATIRDVNARITTYQDLADRLRSVIDARAADPTMVDVPGGDTGLLLRTVKMIGRGEEAKPVNEYSVDTGLVRELREVNRQAAEELGQWASRHEHSGPGGAPIAVSDPRLQTLSDAELEALRAMLGKLEEDPK